MHSSPKYPSSTTEENEISWEGGGGRGGVVRPKILKKFVKLIPEGGFLDKKNLHTGRNGKIVKPTTQPH